MNFDEFCLNEQSCEKNKNNKWTKDYENLEKNGKKQVNLTQKTQNFSNINDFNAETVDEEHIKKLFEKYQNMNSEQLMKELLLEGSKQKKEGKLNEKKLQEIENKLLPLLDEQQKNRLKDLVNMLK